MNYFVFLQAMVHVKLVYFKYHKLNKAISKLE
jgi:hypothetical protein